MLPSRQHALDFEGELKLDDNLEEHYAEYGGEVNYDERPVRVTFAMMLFCRQGSFRMRINLKDYEVSENGLLLVPPGSILDQAYIQSSSRLILMGQNFDGRQGHTFEPLTVKFMSDYKGTPWLFQFTPEEADRLVALYHEMRAVIQDEQNRYRREAITGYRYVLGAYMANAMERQKLTTKDDERGLSREAVLFREFMRLVFDHYTEHREVAFYADKMCITPKYLSVVVSKASHRTPSEWIRDYVILDAKALILSGNHTIQQVSDMLHFANPSFFGKYFKDAVGCAPGKFADSLMQKD